jgi:ferredoxin, 2Fe-2S
MLTDEAATQTIPKQHHSEAPPISPGGSAVATITYIDPAGVRHDIDAHLGSTVMDTAVKNGVPGIVAECGGFLSCASCHVHVDDAWIDRVGKAEEEDEDEILEGAMAERQPGSRLSCQIEVVAELDGLLVRVSPEQF